MTDRQSGLLRQLEARDFSRVRLHYLMSKAQKGEKGQFFTPRYVIDMCVKMLNPNKHEKIIDTAAGSCGFPVHTTFYVWKKINEEHNIPQSHLFTAEKKHPDCEDYVHKNVFAIDFDEKTVRVARTLNLIAGDGKTNVLHLNTLDYERWDEITANQDWIDAYNEGWKGLRKLRAESYKPGGRMAIVLPQGRFNNFHDNM